MGFLRCNLALAPMLITEVEHKALVHPQLEYVSPIWHPYHETQIGQMEKVQRTQLPGRPAGDGEPPVASATCLTNLSEQSSLAFFYKVHSGTVYLDKDNYLTPASNQQNVLFTPLQKLRARLAL